MAGHSKWANIKHRKAAQDAKRGKIFTKLIRELVVAARQGGGNPDDNPRLRAALDKALGSNMTRDTAQRAIDRGAGNDEEGNMDEVTYEGYGPGGIAILVECLTDNRNRTVAEVRHAFVKRGGNLGTDGSVSYLFARKGQLYIEPGANEDAIMEIALESGAEDIITHEDGSIEITTAFEDFLTIKDTLASAKFTVDGDIAMIPSLNVDLNLEQSTKVMALIEMLEDLDDVQNVYSNLAMTDELIEHLS